MSSNKFAEKQLKKHGWKEGSGLGKEEAGIKEAIKVKIKNDTAGIGHNHGDEFTFHWWDHVFNKAAGSISVEDSEEGVSLKKNADNGPISNKTTKSFDNKAMLYGKFVKAATLSNGNYESQTNNHVESDSEDEKEKVRNRLVSDKALEMCEGMTAHKGARHGLKLNGKLVRVQEQEKLLLESMKRTLKKNHGKTSDRKQAEDDIKQNNEESDMSDYESENNQKKKKRKKIKFDKMKSESSGESRKKKKKKDKYKKEQTNEIDNIDSEMIREKKMKRMEKKSVERNNRQFDEIDKQQAEYVESEPVSKKKKKKRKLRHENDDEVQEESDLSESKKKKMKNNECSEVETVETSSLDSDFKSENVARKSKKKKKKN